MIDSINDTVLLSCDDNDILRLATDIQKLENPIKVINRSHHRERGGGGGNDHMILNNYNNNVGYVNDNKGLKGGIIIIIYPYHQD